VGIADRARHLKAFGTLHYGQEFGVNFKFTDLQAVIGIEQMKKLRWRLTRKRAMFQLYRERLAGVEAVTFLDTDLQQTAPWFIDVMVPDPADLQEYLHAQGIGTRRFYQPLRDGFPNAEYAHEQGLWLPSSSFLEDRQIEQVCNAIGAYYTL
jgi:perosamine synthetase